MDLVDAGGDAAQIRLVPGPVAPLLVLVLGAPATAALTSALLAGRRVPPIR